MDTEVKNVPPFSEQDSASTPPRKIFLRRTLIHAILSFLFLDMISSTAVDPEKNRKMFDTRYVPVFSRLSNVTMEELIIRSFITLGSLLGIYVLVIFMQSIVSFTTVLLHISDVVAWRPMFGNVSEAHTLRGFWG